MGWMISLRVVSVLFQCIVIEGKRRGKMLLELFFNSSAFYKCGNLELNVFL